jgi:t-SNARE complex subunit (syntaxin)
MVFEDSDEDYKEKQKMLLEDQEKFEHEQRRLEEERPVIEAQQKKKEKVLSWAILFFIFCLVLFLLFKLLI